MGIALPENETATGRFFLGCLPSAESVLNIWLPEEADAKLPKDLQNSDCDYIILTGVSTQELERFIEKVHLRKAEIKTYFRDQYPAQEYELEIKPILCFESIDAALDCRKFIQGIEYGAAMEMIVEMQLDHYDPWGPITEIPDSYWYQVSEDYR